MVLYELCLKLPSTYNDLTVQDPTLFSEILFCKNTFQVKRTVSVILSDPPCKDDNS